MIVTFNLAILSIDYQSILLDDIAQIIYMGLVLLPFIYTLAKWMRLLRVQVQLRASEENTNVIIKQMNISKRVQYFLYSGYAIGSILGPLALEFDENSVEYLVLSEFSCFAVFSAELVFICHLW